MSSKYTERNLHGRNYKETYIRFQLTESFYIMFPHCWNWNETYTHRVSADENMTESSWDYSIVSALLKLYRKLQLLVSIYFSRVPVLLKRYLSSSVKTWTLRIIYLGFFLWAQTATSYLTNTYIWWFYQEEWKYKWKFLQKYYGMNHFKCPQYRLVNHGIDESFVQIVKRYLNQLALCNVYRTWIFLYLVIFFLYHDYPLGTQKIVSLDFEEE